MVAWGLGRMLPQSPGGSEDRDGGYDPGRKVTLGVAEAGRLDVRSGG